MLKIGIIGGIGSGKSLIASLFELSGIPVYIADTRSKLLTDTSPVIRQALTKLFGETIYTNNTLNKKLLTGFIFSDAAKLAQVNAIIHPEVQKDFLQWTAQLSQPYCAIESAILFESGFNHLVDISVLVYAPPEVRIERVITRDQVDRQQVLQRINNQLPDEEKKEKADFIFYNDNKHPILPQLTSFLGMLNEKSGK
ncbi:MAG: dephospho-CoA kinase [Tannerellaceae bacterium]|nr:dephospho-CoA kinase [Tannerellaceae bacterium]MCD8263030.1 dephospho-CoA kinase [Tannerellaceae bacterium]